MSVKPNFLVIGAMKSATTTLCDLLGEHPDVFMCDPKEPGFFCEDKVYGRGWSWYESLFLKAAGRTAVGEGTTSYTKLAIYPNTAPRVARDLPEARLIYIVRHPLDRIVSHWMHKRFMRETDDSFEESLRNHPQIIDTSLYWRQISAFRAHFPDERILVLFFEQFKSHPESELGKCFDFLGVDPSVKPADCRQQSNPSAHRQGDRAGLRFARRLPLFERINRAIPDGVRSAMKRVLKKTETWDRPQWSEQTRRWVVDQVAEDATRFLAFYGKPVDTWEF